MTIEEIKAGDLTLTELEAEKNLRDQAVQRIRDEMQELHDLCTPKWIAEQLASAGPKHLAQGVSFNVGGVK